MICTTGMCQSFIPQELIMAKKAKKAKKSKKAAK
jgi:hypothetical protein